jgi:hypothetical protein
MDQLAANTANNPEASLPTGSTIRLPGERRPKMGLPPKKISPLRKSKSTGALVT